MIPTKDFAVFWTVEETLGQLCEVPRWLLWRELRCHCPVYIVSCIFNKCLFFHSTWVDTFWTDLWTKYKSTDEMISFGWDLGASIFFYYSVCYISVFTWQTWGVNTMWIWIGCDPNCVCVSLYVFACIRSETWPTDAALAVCTWTQVVAQEM